MKTDDGKYRFPRRLTLSLVGDRYGTTSIFNDSDPLKAVAGKFLIDITDPRFSIPENGDVLAFIRRKNPFAHSDVGSVLFDLARGAEDVEAYCPAPRSYAYVVLHTPDDRIVAIAFDMRGLAFRLGALDRAAALAEGASPFPEIGDDWVRVDPFDPHRTGTHEWLVRLRNAATRANI